MIIGIPGSLRWLGTCLLAGLPGVLMAANAHAQSDRATGIRAGAFIFEPVLGISESYDSNIFEQPTGATGSFITTVNPRISVTSDFSRHRVAVGLGFRQDFFHQSSDDNAFTYFADAEGVIDVTRDLRILLEGGFRREAERRGSDEVGVAVLGPVYSNVPEGRLAVQYLVSDFRVEPFVGVRQRDYIDRGLVVDQDVRDRFGIRAGLELGYRVAPGYEAFVRANYFDIDYDLPVDGTGINRDFNGVETLAGVKLKLSRLIVGSVGAGFVHSTFEDPTLSDTTDFTVQAGLDWTPRRRWTVSLFAERGVEPTNVAGASDKVETDVTLTARYEIIRDVRGFVRGGVDITEFNQLGRTDTGYFAGFGVDWAITRQASLGFSYNFFDENSTTPVNEFTKHTVRLGARYAF